MMYGIGVAVGLLAWGVWFWLDARKSAETQAIQKQTPDREANRDAGSETIAVTESLQKSA